MRTPQSRIKIAILIVGISLVGIVSYPSFEPTKKTFSSNEPELWSPRDPNEPISDASFSCNFAKKLRGFKTLHDLQVAAHSQGKLISIESGPVAIFSWVNSLQNPYVDNMKAWIYPSGFIGIYVSANDFGGVRIFSLNNRDDTEQTNCD